MPITSIKTGNTDYMTLERDGDMVTIKHHLHGLSDIVIFKNKIKGIRFGKSTNAIQAIVRYTSKWKTPLTAEAIWSILSDNTKPFCQYKTVNGRTVVVRHCAVTGIIKLEVEGMTPFLFGSAFDVDAIHTGRAYEFDVVKMKHTPTRPTSTDSVEWTNAV